MHLHKPVVRARETRYWKGGQNLEGGLAQFLEAAGRLWHRSPVRRGFASSLLAARAEAGLHMTELWM